VIDMICFCESSSFILNISLLSLILLDEFDKVKGDGINRLIEGILNC
jgi:hypothetical protein